MSVIVTNDKLLQSVKSRGTFHQESLYNVHSTHNIMCPVQCGLQGCKNRPAPFPGRMSYKATKPGLVLFYIFACFNCIVAYLEHACIVSFRCYVFCLFVVLPKWSVLAK